MDEMENMEQQEVQQDLPEEAQAPQEEKDVYVPRPAWQVWGARVALVLFIVLLIMYYVNLMRGGF